MRTMSFTLAALLFAPLGFAGGEQRTYVGVIGDTMCASNHAPMKVSPDSRCVRECVGDGRAYKYALVAGAKLYTLSDQETPARFAGTKVKVTGVLYTKTNILKVEHIAPTR